jgi:iron complex transport system permease protein
LSSVLAATVTAFAGPISFVGVAVPHLARRALGTAKPALTVPATLMLGASFTLAADLVARCAFAPTEISVSTVTAVVGAPVVLSVLMGRKGRDL